MALQLLTEIADDARLQLLSIAGDYDDQIQREQVNQLKPNDGGAVTVKDELTRDIPAKMPQLVHQNQNQWPLMAKPMTRLPLKFRMRITKH